MNDTTRSEEIGRRAYMLWEQEGRPHGKDWEHWFKAESELAMEGSGPGAGSVGRAERAVKRKTSARAGTGRRGPKSSAPQSSEAGSG